MKGMPNLGKLMKQAQEMQSKMAEVQEELGQIRAEGQSGGGAVKAVTNGHHELLEIQIDPEVVDPEDVEMLQDLIIAAVRSARQEAEAVQKSAMGRVTGGMSLPGGLGL